MYNTYLSRIYFKISTPNLIRINLLGVGNVLLKKCES